MKKSRMKLMVAFAFVAMALALPVSVTIGRTAGQGASKGASFVSVHQSVAYADEAAQAPSGSQDAAQVSAPAEPTWADKILAFISSSGTLVSGLVIVFEIVVRAFPSKNPLSLLVPARYAAASLASIFAFLANLLGLLVNSAQNSQNAVQPVAVKKT